MSNATADWHGYICDAGYFKATFDAAALGADLATPVAPAVVEVSADPEEDDELGVMLALLAGAPVGRYSAAWYSPEQARKVAETLLQDDTPADESVQIGVVDCDGDPVTTEVVTNPADLDGVYLDVPRADGGNPVEVSRYDAAAIAQALLAAVAYLADHGHGDA